ncbi:hypothetical protein ANN_27028 [Periplaneta americana]|uniref:Uncharacterized protein n=1 Tax=Periplaneta americana TaxID=6978 RepID=A0ABQ8RX44_PERAM|nr:hypothetical protein ANN_27028 [Periplaneta americana]
MKEDVEATELLQQLRNLTPYFICCNETETLGHVLGFCRKTELLRNNRHHKARTGIADVLKRRGWEVHEEVHCVSSLDSNRRADIVAIHRTQSKGLVLDPTIRFERDALQAQHVDEEKTSIYESCIPYLSFTFINTLNGHRPQNNDNISSITTLSPGQ